MKTPNDQKTKYKLCTVNISLMLSDLSLWCKIETREATLYNLRSLSSNRKQLQTTPMQEKRFALLNKRGTDIRRMKWGGAGLQFQELFNYSMIWALSRNQRETNRHDNELTMQTHTSTACTWDRRDGVYVQRVHVCETDWRAKQASEEPLPVQENTM